MKLESCRKSIVRSCFDTGAVQVSLLYCSCLSVRTKTCPSFASINFRQVYVCSKRQHQQCTVSFPRSNVQMNIAQSLLHRGLGQFRSPSMFEMCKKKMTSCDTSLPTGNSDSSACSPCAWLHALVHLPALTFGPFFVVLSCKSEIPSRSACSAFCCWSLVSLNIFFATRVMLLPF